MRELRTILYEVERGRARITLNRPEKLNALSFELMGELHDALWEADDDRAVREGLQRRVVRPAADPAMTDFFSAPDDFGEIRQSELHATLGESLAAQARLPTNREFTIRRSRSQRL